MSKDPAVLLYIDKWLVSTKGMRADAKGWYLNLILYQYDLGDLPNDIEELANLCDVRFSEFDKFKQVFEHVLNKKFKLKENGRLENDFAKEILQKRELFKTKRSDAGKMSYFIKFCIKNFKPKKAEISFLKNNVNLDGIDLKNEQVLEQVFKQTLELYINEDVNKDININKNKEIIYPFDSKVFFGKWELWKKYRAEIKKPINGIISEQAALKKLSEISNHNENISCKIIDQSISNNWQGLFKLKDDENGKRNSNLKQEVLNRMEQRLSGVEED